MKENTKYTVQELADLSGISPRTLRYYDEIGLLKPEELTAAGYRLYGEKEVDTLQQILFYRETGLPLKEIGKVIYDPSFNRLLALKDHLKVLEEKKVQIHLLIENLQKTIHKEEGTTQMKDNEKFKGFKNKLIEENEEKYGEEIRVKYGADTVDQSNAKLMGIPEEEYEKMQALSAEILAGLERAVTEGQSPDSDEGQRIAQMHKEWLGYTWPSYSKEAHKGLGEMYVADERFTAYYDSRVKGCAEFLKGAIYCYCKE